MVDQSYSLYGNEIKRLAALTSFDILDTLPEKEYDAIARLASYICRAPVALISFVDTERLWFKSKVGLNDAEIPRADSFCNKTILHDEILEISNLLEDETFRDNAMVTGEAHVRFYAGAPLIDAEGNRVGSLCVLDVVPRKLDVDQLDALRTLAAEVMSHLVLKKQKKELQANLKLHQNFYNLFNSSPEIHLIGDSGARIELVNDVVLKVLGYEPQRVSGLSLWDFVTDEQPALFAPLIENGLLTGQSFELETQNTTFNNEIKWIGWCAVYKAGKWYLSGRDVTEQKRTLAQLQMLSLVAGKVSNGVMISNAEDKIIWVNEGFEKITGYNLSDVESKRLPEVLKGPAGGIKLDKGDWLMQTGPGREVERQVIRKDGAGMWLSIVNTVIYNNDGTVEKNIRVVNDITARKQVEQELEILSFAARKSPNGTLIRDTDGAIIWMNEALEEIFGYTLGEMKGKTFGTMLNGPDTDLAVFNNAINAIREKRGYEIEILLYKKDRTPIWVSISNSPLINDEGHVERQVGVLVDITERKKGEIELKTLSLVASNTTSGVVINNSLGEVEWINPAFEHITGYTIADVQHRHLGDVLKGEHTDISIIERARELSRNKKSFDVDLLVYRKDGGPIWISVINSVILNSLGEVEKYIEVIIDISAKKKVELELIAAKEEALQLNRAKDMFISVMSHEIRTPLNAVIGISHLLLDENPMDYQKENLSVLKFSAQNLMGLINDVLDLTKIETGNVELEKVEVDLRELVNGVISSMQYKTAEKNIFLKQQIDEAIPGRVVADPTRLSQILLNLVGNAVKFTEEGGVDINIKLIEQTVNNVRIRFEIKDTGIGIANDKLKTIFESFKQAEADTTRKYGGTGLGLAISKRLIELHDSRINVDSVPGKGSNFWFTLTFNKSNNTNKLNNNVDSALNINVLVVDDNQINRLLINKILGKWGAKAEFAENGLQAIEKLEGSQKYDVVLMDIHMPEMGGLEATQVIRAKSDGYFKQLPIIALTASMMSSQMGEIGDSGMNDYILKPFEPKVLFEKLSRYQKQ